MAFGEVMMPMTEHSAEILAGAWPSQSVMAWSGYAMQFSQAANNLFKELDVQMDIKQILAPMEGAFIDAARGLEAGRETALQNRIEAYRHISKKAHWAANELQSTKSDLVEIVNSAEEKIQTSRENAEKAKAVAAQTSPLTAPAAIAAIEAQLEAAIAGIVSAAKAEAHARDMQGAGTVAALSTDIAQWAEPFVNHILPQSGGMPGLSWRGCTGRTSRNASAARHPRRCQTGRLYGKATIFDRPLALKAPSRTWRPIQRTDSDPQHSADCVQTAGQD